MDQPTAPPPLSPPSRPHRMPEWHAPVVPSIAPPEPPARTMSAPVIVVLCLVVLALAGVVGRAVLVRLVAGPKPTAAQVDDPISGIIAPDQLIRHGNEKGGYVFRRRLARAAERATKRTVPGSSVMFDEETVIEDLGAVVRGRVGYRGQVRDTPNDFEGVTVEGEQRQYFHSQGAIIVDAVCVPALSGCGNRDSLLDTAEAQVLDNLSQPGIDALLPARGRCDVKHEVMAGSLATCEFSDPGVVLTVQKLELAEARRTLRGLSGDARSSSQAR